MEVEEREVIEGTLFEQSEAPEANPTPEPAPEPVAQEPAPSPEPAAEPTSEPATDPEPTPAAPAAEPVAAAEPGNEGEPPAEPAPAPVEGKLPYTPDELKQILADDKATLDTSRLDEQGQAIHKAIIAGLTPKLQERGELKRDVEELKTRLAHVTSQYQPPQPQPQQPTDAKSVVQREFRRNPQGVLAEIRGTIQNERMAHSQEIAANPYSEEAQKHQNNIIQLEGLKDELVESMVINDQTGRRLQSIKDDAMSYVRESVPDIDTKHPKLTEFMVSHGVEAADMGIFTDPVLMHTFGEFLQKSGFNVDPANMSRAGARLAKAINGLYESSLTAPANGGTPPAVPQPTPVKTPTAVQNAGTGDGGGKADEGRWGNSAYMAMRSKAHIT